jgi:hypothetical protein
MNGGIVNQKSNESSRMNQIERVVVTRQKRRKSKRVSKKNRVQEQVRTGTGCRYRLINR